MVNEAFIYDVQIVGLKVPLRTTVQGAISIFNSFHKGRNMGPLLLEAVNNGKPFKSKLITVSKVVVAKSDSRIKRFRAVKSGVKRSR